MFSGKHLHIISHMVPWPANFGGVIDIYNTIIALSDIGVKIHLHCFTQEDFPTSSPLDKYCESINYYTRITGFAGLSFTHPYITNSRRSNALIHRLLLDTHPILAQGIHCSGIILHPAISERKTSLRLFNVEAVYYRTLARLEKNIFRKLYFKIEAGLIEKQEGRIAKRTRILPLSTADEAYYKHHYAADDIKFIPAFTHHKDVDILSGRGEYCLYHGNLGINENDAMALWLIDHVFIDKDIPCIIAGRNPSDSLIRKVALQQHIKLIANPPGNFMLELVREAHVHIIPSLNKTGVKLKLLEVMFNGRHCITNPAGVHGSGLDTLCEIKETPADMQIALATLMHKDFTDCETNERKRMLKSIYNNKTNAILTCEQVL